MLDECIKKLKQAKELKIEYREHNNEFFSSVKGIINNMDNKKKRITNNEVMDRLNRLEEIVLTGFKQVNSRLDRLENDVAQIKQCPTIKRELDELNNN